MDNRQKQKQHKKKNNSNNKTSSNNNKTTTTVNLKRSSISQQKRHELNTLVSCIIELGLKMPNNPKEEWDQYIDLQAILKRIIAIEKVIGRPISNVNRLDSIDNFYKWVTANGMRYDGIKIAEFPGYELGLEATRDITKDENLFGVPRKLILSEENLPKETLMQFESMSNVRLAFALIFETLNANSFWRPYIDLLPDCYNTVLYFTTEQMEQLKGTTVLSQALRQCKYIARQYAFIYNCTQQAKEVDKMTKNGLLFREYFTYELYRWAVSTAMTRENLIPKSTVTPTSEFEEKNAEPIAALIPFWDMANHRNGNITSFYNVETQELESSALMDFKRGEQIFMHYGYRTNVELLLHNGFINPHNPTDYIVVKLGLNAADKLFEKRSQLLDLLKITKKTVLKVLPAPDMISSELLTFVRVFNMNEDQLEHWIRSDRVLDLLHSDCALETDLEVKTWTYLQTRLMLLLRVCPTTLEEDEAQLARYKDDKLILTAIEAMILEYRVLEKRILTDALNYAKQKSKA